MGEPLAAADALEQGDGRNPATDAVVIASENRLALINALRWIDQINNRLAWLEDNAGKFK